MSSTAQPTTVDALPSYPSTRECPYQPPAAYDRYRGAQASPQQIQLYNGRVAWLITNHAQARTVLANPGVSADRSRLDFPMLSERAEATQGQRQSFPSMDPPEHGSRRRRLLSEFTVRRVKQMRPRIEQIVADRIDALLAAGPPADLVSLFSLPVPSLVICELLGVPYADHEFFEDASRRAIQGPGADEVRRAFSDLVGYLRGLITEREREPGAGLLSRLVHDEVSLGTVDREDLVVDAMALLIAGHETTASMTSMGVLTLHEHPEQLAQLKADPGLSAKVGEELLRYLTIADPVTLARVAATDLQIGDQHIRAGEAIVVASMIANRDDAAFENPDRFDIHRSARQHLAFGYGVHQCLGQNLARLELEVIFGTVYQRIPTLSLAVPVEELEFRPGTTIQGVDHLPVTW